MISYSFYSYSYEHFVLLASPQMYLQASTIFLFLALQIFFVQITSEVYTLPTIEISKLLLIFLVLVFNLQMNKLPSIPITASVRFPLITVVPSVTAVTSQVFWTGGTEVGGTGDEGVPVAITSKTTASFASQHVPLLTFPNPLSPQSVPHEVMLTPLLCLT